MPRRPRARLRSNLPPVSPRPERRRPDRHLPEEDGVAAAATPGAAFFTATCSGCHGTPELTGRAPYLFDQKWLDGTDDEKIATTDSSRRA